MAADGMIMAKLLRHRYDNVKARYPHEGRRRVHLRIAQEFWSLAPNARFSLANAPFMFNGRIPAYQDPDPSDPIASHSPALGIIVRTDYSNDVAWAAFVGHVEDAEREFHALHASRRDEGPSGSADPDDSDDSDDSESPPPPVFQILAPPSSYPLHPYLRNATNLTLLRLLNNVNIVPAPRPPPPPVHHRQPHRLIDDGGFVETYTGKGIWVYDFKSNRDQCLRVVGGAPAGYGYATGDSWRARVAHICELQVALASGGLSIDFSGRDRWDPDVRAANMQQALVPIT